MLTRRQALLAAAATIVVGAAGFYPAHAADKAVKIGIDLSLTAPTRRAPIASRMAS
jgi:hypothetical protein